MMETSVVLKAVLLVVLLAACSPLAFSRTADDSTRPAAAVPTAPIADTAKPSIVAARAADHTPTPQPTATSDPMALSQTATALASAVLAAAPPTPIASYPSPDGAWRIDVVSTGCVTAAEQAGADNQAVEQVLRVERDGGAVTEIASQLTFCGGLGSYGFEGLTWSSNSRFFYFTTAREGSPDGLCWFWEPTISRLEAATGRVEPIGGGPLSPDGTRLATWQNRDVVIWDLNLGELARVPAAGAQSFGGPIAWAPDGASIVYLENGAGCPPFRTTRLTRVDMAHGRPLVLLDSATRTFSTVAWPEPNRLTLYDELGAPWSFDLSTRDLAPNDR